MEIKRVLIANRGEIALRALRTIKEMGKKAICVYSTADKDALYLKYADASICIGNARSSESYLNIPNIISAAEIAEADAIFPGYGFLSENQNFVEICAKHNIKFIGPSVEAMTLMSDKSKAKQMMQRAGVPVIPGSDGAIKGVEEAKKLASKMGYPVILKAAAGGGGRGMRVVEKESELEKAYWSAESEAMTAFGDGTMYMEKYIQNPRHIEVQIIGDSFGNIVHIGERDCSMQRRHQKLIEESPAILLDDKTRKKLHETAIKAARAIGYEGAGTFEFLVDKNLDFYFIEMNTRLQVEHPVTEFVTDTDLVKWQLRVAAGQPLPFEQEDMPVRNHAMECRINAETPDFLPSCGTVTALRVPGGPRVRWDSAMFTGANVPPYYDSMLGKLIVCAPTRDGAIRKMRSALGELVIEGVSENSELQLDVLANDEFLSGMYHTDLMGHLYADE